VGAIILRGGPVKRIFHTEQKIIYAVGDILKIGTPPPGIKFSPHKILSWKKTFNKNYLCYANR